jgi:hypothetical protein
MTELLAKTVADAGFYLPVAQPAGSLSDRGPAGKAAVR